MHPCPTCGCHVRRIGPCPTCAAPAAKPSRTAAAVLLGLALAGCGGDKTTTDTTTGDTATLPEALYGVTVTDTIETTDDHTGR
ncbi:MAG: hypothetical protein H6738_09570 [Alphaproteobacteria bacterium]|nr:hypothetical protein [Alphaproteobacteria bacterium]